MSTSTIKPEIKQNGKEADTKEPPKTEAVVSKVDQKVVTFTKIGNGRWDVNFAGKITRREINRLRISMLVEFNRMRRKIRLAKRVDLRATKEQTSGN